MPEKCAIVFCPWNATDRGYCAAHSNYCVETYLGPRRLRAKFVPVAEKGSLTCSIPRRWFDDWRETGELPPRPNRRMAI